MERRYNVLIQKFDKSQLQLEEEENFWDLSELRWKSLGGEWIQGCQNDSAAKMMVEAHNFSKMQVHDAILASTNNVLHTDGKKNINLIIKVK